MEHKPNQKSENIPPQISDSTLFFQSPPFKRWSLDPTPQETRKTCAIGIAESERKTRTKFPELFRLRDQNDQFAEQYALQSITPSRHPSYIPYITQHIILGTAQNILEECCYDFSGQWFPSELENRGWDCAEAVELTKWTRIINEHSEKLPSYAFAAGRTLSKDILISVHLLRHTAVHRLRITAREVGKLIQYALKFMGSFVQCWRAWSTANVVQL
jgi:hypothetical protein